ncbi:MAG: photosynthetic reaction center cytochrome PufC [Gammaproteobacteria bacterium]
MMALLTSRHPVAAAFALAGVLALVAGCENPANTSVQQQGYRGTGMVAVSGARALAVNNAIPEPMAPVPGGGPLAKDIYQNIQVLTDLDVGQFTRLMTAITQWVAPEQGCAYCHADGDNASDAKYQKVVSRRMLEMTRHINGEWTTHVAQTGVTCYTCHRGNNVPAQKWFAPADPHTRRSAGNRAGQNAPGIGLTALPGDPFSAYLTGDSDIRVVASNALATADRGATIQDTERTYAFMTHITESLGVNCTGCHNTRSYFAWDQSRPQRVPAWHGIRMARDLNNNYLIPLTGAFPAERLGPTGDVAKISCATCHQGVSKPLNGVSMLKDYPELLPGKPAPTQPLPEEAAPEGAAPGEAPTAMPTATGA